MEDVQTVIEDEVGTIQLRLLQMLFGAISLTGESLGSRSSGNRSFHARSVVQGMTAWHRHPSGVCTNFSVLPIALGLTVPRAEEAENAEAPTNPADREGGSEKLNESIQ